MVWRLFPGRFGDQKSFLPRLRRMVDLSAGNLSLDDLPESYIEGAEEGTVADLGAGDASESEV